MHKAIIYAAVVTVLVVPGALLAAVLRDSEEEQLEQIIDGIERERLGALIEHGAFEGPGLVVSAGSDLRTYDLAGREAARERLDELTGIGSADRVRLRQQQVTVREGRADAVLNVEVGDGSFVGLRLRIVNASGRWLVERVRVMS